MSSEKAKTACGSLYVVATPIGNREDITIRALSILKQVDIIFCEDTRQTNKILNIYQIRTPTKSYHTHSGESKSDFIIQTLLSGKNCALVTDAGTPGISDPGPFLIAKIRAETNQSIKIIPIPGPDAITSILSVAGVNTQPFTFFGFLPAKKGREKSLNLISNYEHTVVVYESTHRIKKLLESLHQRGVVKVILGKELTKVNEQVIIGEPKQILKKFSEDAKLIKGEFVLVIPPTRNN